MREYGFSEKWTDRKYKAAYTIGHTLGFVAELKRINTVSIWDFTAGPGIDPKGRRNVLLNIIDGFCVSSSLHKLRCVGIEDDPDRHKQLAESISGSGYSQQVTTRCGEFSKVVSPGEISGWGAVLFDPRPKKEAIVDTHDLVRLSGGLDIISYWSLTTLNRLKLEPDKWLSMVTVNGRDNVLWNDPPTGNGSDNRFQWAWLWASRARLNGPFNVPGYGTIKGLNRRSDYKWLRTNKALPRQLELFPRFLEEKCTKLTGNI